MAIDYQAQVTLGLMAGTLAEWLRDNGPHYDELNEQGEGDADEFGMYAMATGYLRMYKELIDLGEVSPLEYLKAPTQEIN